MKRSIVITTINSPTRALIEIGTKATENDIPVIVVGDSKTPNDFKYTGLSYYSIDKQHDLFPEFSKNLPLNHYSRKNIGYLVACKVFEDIEVIHETDDDNYPLDNFWEDVRDTIRARELINEGSNKWCNIYEYFTEKKIWPRGLPLIEINSTISYKLEEKDKEVHWLIIQGQADMNPDVDAIYRFTYPLPVIFNPHLKVLINPGLWSPFNSQNTIFKREVFPLLYLPSHCSFRMTDIWRSFIAQRCLWEFNKGIVFTYPTVRQDRNEHDLIKDFDQEIPGYLNNSKITDLLFNLDLAKDLIGNMFTCYEALIKEEVFPSKEIDLLTLWLYEFR